MIARKVSRWALRALALLAAKMMVQHVLDKAAEGGSVKKSRAPAQRRRGKATKPAVKTARAASR